MTAAAREDAKKGKKQREVKQKVADEKEKS